MGPAMRKVESLIVRFQRTQGSFPESWTEIAAAYPDDLTYEYVFQCENHPWKHVWIGHLDRVNLRHVAKSDWEGHEEFEFSLYGDEAAMFPIYLSLPQ